MTVEMNTPVLSKTVADGTTTLTIYWPTSFNSQSQASIEHLFAEIKMGIEDAYSFVSEAILDYAFSDDVAERFNAFTEKRTP